MQGWLVEALFFELGGRWRKAKHRTQVRKKGWDISETDLPKVKCVSQSLITNSINHQRQCQHHKSEGRCLGLRHTKTKNGVMDLKIPEGWKQMVT